MEALRELMYEYIDLYGVTDEKTVYVSQQLDLLILESMKKQLEIKGA